MRDAVKITNQKNRTFELSFAKDNWRKTMYDDEPFNGLVGDEMSAEALSRKSQTAGSISFEFLKAKDEEYRRMADANQSEYREYRQMAWACRFVMEIWNDKSNDLHRLEQHNPKGPE